MFSRSLQGWYEGCPNWLYVSISQGFIARVDLLTDGISSSSTPVTGSQSPCSSTTASIISSLTCSSYSSSAGDVASGIATCTDPRTGTGSHSLALYPSNVELPQDL